MSKIDYDLTKIKAFVFDVDGVLSSTTVLTDSEGDPIRTTNIKDGFALQLAIKNNYKIAVITGGMLKGYEERLRSYGITDICQGAAVKQITLYHWMEREGLAPSEVLYMGDDLPDIECMRVVGLPTAPADACSEILNEAKYISTRDSGHGCVRDVIEQVLKSRNSWCNDIYATHW